MAKGTPRGGVTTNRTLKLAHSAAVEAGDIIVSNGQVLVAEGDYAQDVEGIYTFKGPVEFPKAGSLALAVGDKAYFDVADGNVNATATDNTLCGIVIEAAADADTVVLIELASN
jgi:predicted RecA/RadA family phage recombinase